MSGFNVYQDSYIGATIISNRFIDEYMTEANDAQLKVYLYLVRMLNAHLETNVSDIADRFNHTEKDVMRAFSYWEKKGLLTLDYDEKGELCGVHLINLCKGDASMPSVEATHNKVRPTKVASNKVAPVKVPEPEIPVKTETPQKRKKTVADSEVLFLAETYFQQPLSPNDVEILGYIQNDLGFSFDLMDYLLQYCAEKKKKDYHYIEKVAIGWHSKGVTTVAEATGENLKHDKIVYTILNRLGKQSAPTDIETEFIRKWIKDYGFSESVIMDACDRTVLRTDNNRLQYCDGILSSWHKAGAHSREEIEALNQEYSSKKNSNLAEADFKKAGTTARNTRTQSAGSFGKFQQNDIDFEALEKKIFIN